MATVGISCMIFVKPLELSRSFDPTRREKVVNQLCASRKNMMMSNALIWVVGRVMGGESFVSEKRSEAGSIGILSDGSGMRIDGDRKGCGRQRS